MLWYIVWKLYSFFCRPISIPTHDVSDDTALSALSNYLVNNELVCITRLVRCRASRIRFMRVLAGVFSLCAVSCHDCVWLGGLLHEFCGGRRLCSICRASPWLRCWLTRPRCNTVQVFVVEVLSMCCSPKRPRRVSKWSLKAVCQDRHNYQRGMMLFLAIGGRSQTCIVLGSSAWVCQPWFETLQDEL